MLKEKAGVILNSHLKPLLTFENNNNNNNNIVYHSNLCSNVHLTRCFMLSTTSVALLQQMDPVSCQHSSYA